MVSKQKEIQMNVNIPGQTIQVPDPTPPYNDKWIMEIIVNHEERLKKLEGVVVPIPPIPPTPPSGFSLYSPDSFWNKKLASPTVHTKSSAFVSELNENMKLAGGWISGLKEPAFGTSIYFVDANTPKVTVHIRKGANSRLVEGVPMPSNPVVAQGTDGHLCIISKSENKEWDFFQLAYDNVLKEWYASDAGVLPNVSTCDGIMPKQNYWNSATATHLPLAGGKITLKESDAGIIPHALAISINRPLKGNAVWPARTSDGWWDGANAIPEGTRFFFPQSIVINPNWTPLTKMLVVAVRDYGMVVMDKTSAGFAFYHEDTTQYGKVTKDVIRAHMGGREIWNILGSKSNSPEFPIMKLQVIA